MEKTVKIIGGIVSYEDGIKTVAGDQFSPTRKVRVELNFSLDDGDEDRPYVLSVMNTAQSLVQEKLGISGPTAAATRAVEHKPEAVKAETQKPPRAPGRPKAEPKPSSDELTTSAETAKPATKADLAAAAGLPADDGIADLLGESPKPAKEITDADMNDAAQRANAKINTAENPAGPRIRELAKKFIPDPTKPPVLREIPQDKRAEFLKQLAELK